MRLDRIVQASVISASDSTPRSRQRRGHCTCRPPGRRGTGQDGTLAAFDGTAWVFVPPQDGWLVYVKDQDVLWRFMSGTWAPVPNAETMPLLGINGTADNKTVFWCN